MRRLVWTFLIGLLAAPLHAASVTLAWDANAPGTVSGYRILYGTMSGQEATVVDVGNVTQATIAGLTSGQRYFFVAVAYNTVGTSPFSNEVSGTFTDPVDPCSFPLGATSVQIFVTGKLNLTGSGGAGSKAFITFQTASPGSPVTFASIRANGVDVPDSVTQGTNLHAISGLWFTLPSSSGPYALSVYALNAAGCSKTQATGFTVMIP
jgi:fibronectin type III domain protein